MKCLMLICILLLSILPVFAQPENTAGKIKEELSKLSSDWMIAVKNRDEKTLNKIVAPEFTLGGTDFENPGISRETWMKNTMENLKIDSVHYIKMHVELKDNIAIVQSLFYWSVAFREFPTKKDTVNLIDTWIKRNGAWQVISRLVVNK